MVWIMPTISRPEKCRSVLQRITDHGCSTPGVVIIEGDGAGYENLPLPSGWLAVLMKDFTDVKGGSVGAFNFAFNHLPNEPWYGLFGDDEYLMEDSPPDWDRRLVEAAGAWDISHGWENLNQGKRAQGYVVVGGELVRNIGFIGVPACRHNFGVDCMLEWMAGIPVFGGGGACRIHCVPEVKIDHKHHLSGAATNDECYQVAHSHFDDDRVKFTHWVRNELPEIAKRVRTAREVANAMA